MNKELLQTRRRNSVPRCEAKATPQREIKSSSPQIHCYQREKTNEKSNTKLPNSFLHNQTASLNQRDGTTFRRTQAGKTKEFALEPGAQTNSCGSKEILVTGPGATPIPPKNEALRRQGKAVLLRKDVTPPSSHRSTPKKTSDDLGFLVTGKQILRRSERAYSLPGSSRLLTNNPRTSTKCPTPSLTSTSGHTSLADDTTLDLSQVSDDEETTSRYSQHVNNRTFTIATSTPKHTKNTSKNLTQPRRASLQQNNSSKEVPRRTEKFKEDGRNLDISLSREDGIYTTISAVSDSRSTFSSSSDLAYSSTSPDYSGESSAISRPTTGLGTTTRTCQSYQDNSTTGEMFQHNTKKAGEAQDHIDVDGEWNNFWMKYNNTPAVCEEIKSCDRCPTPFARYTFDGDFSTASTIPLPATNWEHSLNIEDLTLTSSETRDLFKCAQILGNVLTTAIQRQTKNDQGTKIGNNDEKGLKKN